MALKDFLEKAKANAPKPYDPNASQDQDSLKLIYMNAPINQGVIKFIPITSVSGDELRFLYDVTEFQVYKINDDGEAQWRWGKVLNVKDYTSNLTEENKAQIGRIQSKVSTLIDNDYGNDWARMGKNYALIFGYVLNHINTDMEVQSDVNSRSLALIVLPSKNVAKAMQTLSEGLLTSSSGEQQYEMLFNRSSEDRKLYLEISFKKGSGFGYDVVINAKMFDLFSGDMLTPDEQKVSAVTVPQNLIDLAINQSASFLGNRENGEDFIQEHITQLDEQTDIEISKVTAKSKLPEKPELDHSNNDPTSSWGENAEKSE